MGLEERMLGPFTKAKYLGEQKYKNYITIVNYLYDQHEVYYSPPSLPSSILEHIITNDSLGIFDEYNLDELNSDLKQLEEWGNVIAHPDSSLVSSIADFNKRKMRYQCTQETIEIERMMENLGNRLHLIKNSLDSGLVNSLTSSIMKLAKFEVGKDLSREEREDLVKLWVNIFEEFDKLRRESSDYLGIIHSKSIEDAMQNKEISVFRSKFTEYLTGFIITLQKNINLIDSLITTISGNLVEWVVSQLVIDQKQRPTLEEELEDEKYVEIYLNQWESMRKWFIYDQVNERYVDYLLKQTSDTISRFTKYLQQMSERDQQVKNRKKNFEHIAKLFQTEKNFDLCKRSFGAMTNVEMPLHLFSSNIRYADAEITLYMHEPEIKLLSNATERPSVRKRKMVAIQQTEEDKLALIEINKQKEHEERFIQALVDLGKVVIKELQDVEPFVRQTLLNWIAQVSGTEKMTGKTDRGVSFRIEHRTGDRIHLHCVDGQLEMPDYIFHFKEVK
jgi:uncharacterized protein (TIGR02677 family)